MVTASNPRLYSATRYFQQSKAREVSINSYRQWARELVSETAKPPCLTRAPLFCMIDATSVSIEPIYLPRLMA